MDNAPLTLAHVHARNAVFETQNANPKAALQEHELAAGEFANAREATRDSEALRILTLLEEHHRNLASAIKFQARTTQTTTSREDAERKHTAASEQTGTSPKAALVAETRKSTSPARVRRTVHRDLSSSIASNLATARGKPSMQRRPLPSMPQVTPQHAEGHSFPRVPDTKAPKDSSTAMPSARDEPSARQAKDDSFQKFYSTFESLFSKLSSPLAFAGLPLTPEQAQPEAEKDSQTPERNRVPSSDEPELANIYSKAALRVIREDGGQGVGVQDSFYWVQPSGGTESYANMVSRRGGHNAHVPETIEEDAEEFVDARETPGPPSPKSLRGSTGREKAGSRWKDVKSAGGKTMEELELENTALRQLLDTQSRRLQMWEASAQAQSLAFSQSLRSARAPTSGESAADDSAKVHELEEMLRTERAERDRVEHRNEKMERENEKLLASLGRYREKWEVLKEGARRRDKAAKVTPSVAGTEAGSDRGGVTS